VDTLTECLLKCEEALDCEFFNYSVDGGEKNSCDGLANCEMYSSDSCTDCNVGKRSCKGKLQRLNPFQTAYSLNKIKSGIILKFLEKSFDKTFKFKRYFWKLAIPF